MIVFVILTKFKNPHHVSLVVSNKLLVICDVCSYESDAV